MFVVFRFQCNESSCRVLPLSPTEISLRSLPFYVFIYYLLLLKKTDVFFYF